MLLEVPLKTHWVCQTTAHNVSTTSQPCSVVVSYHLPSNLTENVSLRCAMCRSVFLCLEGISLCRWTCTALTVIPMAICRWNVKCNCYWSVFRHRDLKGFVVAWLRRLFRHDLQELFPWFALQDMNQTEGAVVGCFFKSCIICTPCS